MTGETAVPRRCVRSWACRPGGRAMPSVRRLSHGSGDRGRRRLGRCLGWRMPGCRARPGGERRAVRLAVPLLFGADVLLVCGNCWCAGLNVPAVILPPPSVIAARIARALPILWADFVQTFVKGALIGLCHRLRSAASCVAILVDRSPFLQTRPAAGRQFHRRAADRRHRADHGDVVRLRLAVQGGGGRRDGVLPDAGEHRRRACASRARCSAT